MIIFFGRNKAISNFINLLHITQLIFHLSFFLGHKNDIHCSPYFRGFSAPAFACVFLAPGVARGSALGCAAPTFARGRGLGARGKHKSGAIEACNNGSAAAGWLAGRARGPRAQCRCEDEQEVVFDLGARVLVKKMGMTRSTLHSANANKRVTRR